MTNASAIATTKPPDNLDVTAENAAVQALAQADAYESVFAPTRLELDNNDVIEIPPPPDYGMLSDERMEAYEELLFDVDTKYDREPDIFIPEQNLKGPDGEDSGIVLPAETRRGDLKRPYRITNADGTAELVKPPHTVKVVQTVLGEQEYARLKAGGKVAGDVWRIWGEHAIRIRERQAADSKSVRSPVAVAAVPESNS